MINFIAIGLSCLILSAGHTPPEGGDLGPGPGDGWGFPNGNPDGYGFWSQGSKLAICQGRTTEYYVQRYMMLPGCQLVFPECYNPYVMRSQRFIPYTGCGGCHPFSGEITPTMLSMTPYDEGPASNVPVVKMPRFVGVLESEPINRVIRAAFVIHTIIAIETIRRMGSLRVAFFRFYRPMVLRRVGIHMIPRWGISRCVKARNNLS